MGDASSGILQALKEACRTCEEPSCVLTHFVRRLIRVVPEVWRCRAFRLTSGAAEREVFLWGDTTRVLDEIHFSGSFEKQLTWGVKSHNAYPCNLLGVVLKFEVTGG